MFINLENQVALVTGASRGIGLNLVFVLTERIPSATIFAGARDPASSTELNEFAEKHPNVKVIKLIADDLESNKQAVEAPCGLANAPRTQPGAAWCPAQPAAADVLVGCQLDDGGKLPDDARLERSEGP